MGKTAFTETHSQLSVLGQHVDILSQFSPSTVVYKAYKTLTASITEAQLLSKSPTI